jgi:putative oxidoreductase
MNTLQQIDRWSLTHHPRWLVVLRVALGICLFIKGISFLYNTTLLHEALQSSSFMHRYEWAPLFITWMHLLGGFLILIGMLTRWAVLLQLPILLGAVIYNFNNGLFANNELPFAIVILLLLILFLVEGGGPLSLDNWLRKNMN